jgi:hypothetical protein
MRRDPKGGYSPPRGNLVPRKPPRGSAPGARHSDVTLADIESARQKVIDCARYVVAYENAGHPGHNAMAHLKVAVEALDNIQPEGWGVTESASLLEAIEDHFKNVSSLGLNEDAQGHRVWGGEYDRRLWSVLKHTYTVTAILIGAEPYPCAICGKGRQAHDRAEGTIGDGQSHAADTAQAPQPATDHIGPDG